MRTESFSYLVNEIYAIFNRNCPHINSPAYSTMKRMVCEENNVPDEAVRYILQRFGNYDDMPRNVGKAILREFDNWLREHPEKRAFTHSCPECDKNVPGMFYIYDATGKEYAVKCSCNTREEDAKYDTWTHAKAKSLGFTLKRPSEFDPLDPNLKPSPWLRKILSLAAYHDKRKEEREAAAAQSNGLDYIPSHPAMPSYNLEQIPEENFYGPF